MNKIFQQGFFQIDPNLDPDGVKDRRERLAGMIRGGYGSAKSTPEGLTHLAAGIMAGIKNRKLNKVEEEGRSSANDVIAALLRGQAPQPSGASGPMTVLGVRPTPEVEAMPIPDSPEAVANDTMAAIGQDPAARIHSGLVRRGMAPHVAEAFVMNMRDESGLDSGINEIEPLVPGSRGGFGLAQWTGPRRVALEQFAQERGVDASDMDTQLDFLMAELEGPEARAAQSIMAASDAPTAAAAIVNQFLRPAEVNRAKREAQYLGGNQPAPNAMPQPAMSDQMAPLLEAMQNPWLTQPQRQMVMTMIQQVQEQNDPMRALEMERAQLEVERMRNPQPEQTASMREYNLAKAQGYTGTFTEYKTEMAQAGRSTTNVTVGGQGEVGTIPQGFELITDPDTGARSLRAIPGGPEDPTDANERREGNIDTATQTITTAATYARQAAQNRKVDGVLGGIAAFNPESQNAELYRQVDVLKSQAKISNLQAMREASKTGGALGAVSAPELIMLEDAAGALDPKSPNFERDLDNYERTLLRVIHGREAGDAMFEQTRPGPATDADGWTTINGVKIRVKQ